MSDNVQIVQAGYADFLSGNIPGVLNRFADEFTFTVPGAPEVPRKTGKRYESDWAMAWTLRDGKVVAFHEYSDPTQLKAAVAT